MISGAAALSSLDLATALIEQRVLCLKITTGLSAEASLISDSCVSVVSGIQFINNPSHLSLALSPCQFSLGNLTYFVMHKKLRKP